MIESIADHRRTRVHTVQDILTTVDQQLRAGEQTGARATATGFEVLDDVLGGGLRAGELLMLGGPPGVGKTITALQWARNVAADGGTAIFACYEHEPITLLLRLLGLEVGALGGDESFARRLFQLLALGETGQQGIEEIMRATPVGQRALERVRSYGDKLLLVRASGSHTTLQQLGELAGERTSGTGATVLFVDYLQKIPLQPEPPTEDEKITRTVEGLKDLALEHHVPIVVLSAVDVEGMRASRLRLFHLRGSSAVAFESDVVLMMNSKDRAVSKVHLSYDPVGARTFRDWVVMSVEKNRGGPNLIDLEFRKDFSHFRLDPQGGIVSEKLVDERQDESAI